MTSIITDRLTLRTPQHTDREQLICALNNLNVSRWTQRVPYPYGAKDADTFLDYVRNKPATAIILFITLNDELIGCMSVENGELGYWLAEPHWGKGIATEAARAVLDYAFHDEDRTTIDASYFKGNIASGQVLAKLGFQEVSTGLAFSNARQANVPLVNLVLTRAEWAKQVS